MVCHVDFSVKAITLPSKYVYLFHPQFVCPIYLQHCITLLEIKFIIH